MRVLRVLSTMVLPLALLTACDDGDEITGPDFDTVAGEWEARSVVFTDADGNTRDLVAEGGVYTLSLDNDGRYTMTLDNDGVGMGLPLDRNGTYQLTEGDLVMNDNPWIDVDPLEPLTLKYQRDELGLTLEGSGRYDVDEDGVLDPIDLYMDFGPA